MKGDGDDGRGRRAGSCRSRAYASGRRWQPGTVTLHRPMTRNIPEKPALEGLEAKWMERWETEGTYRFDRSKERSEIFSIDTPPPTVSGSLHMGSVFGYVQTDAHARYRRMKGNEVFYPMGWDDNGLPTERRVQNYYGVRCDPTLPYDPDFTPPMSHPIHRSRSADGTSSSCATDSPPRTRRSSKTCGARSGCPSIGSELCHHRSP